MGERRGGVGRWRRLPASRKERLRVGREGRNDPAIILSPRQDLPGDVGADLGAAADEARRLITKVGRKGLVIGRRSRRIESDEYVMSGLRRGRLGRSAEAWPQTDPIRFEIALDGVDRIEHRDVRHRVKTGSQRIARLRKRALKKLVPFQHDGGGRMRRFNVGSRHGRQGDHYRRTKNRLAHLYGSLERAGIQAPSHHVRCPHPTRFARVWK